MAQRASVGPSPLPLFPAQSGGARSSLPPSQTKHSTHPLEGLRPRLKGESHPLRTKDSENPEA